MQGMNERHKALVQSGSVPAYANSIGSEHLAAEAMQELTDQAPEELKGSWIMVITWARYQLAYERAYDLGDSKGQLASSDAIRKMIEDRY